MYKLILGIVTIGVLQFALMMYLQMQQPAEKQVAQLRPALSNALPAAVQQEESRPDDSTPPENETEIFDAPVPTSSYRRATSISLRKSRRLPAERSLTQAAEQAKFDTVVIGYNVPPPPTDCGSPNNTKQKENTQFAAASAPRWKVVKTEALSFE